MENNKDKIKYIQMDEICVCCGEPVPEGTMVCEKCKRDIQITAIHKEDENMIYRVYNTKERRWETNPNTVIFKNSDVGVIKKGKLGKKYKLQLLSETKYIIEQYIGVQDKNGKRIYEGDILKLKIKGKPIVGVVVYAPEECAYVLIDYGENTYYPLGREICSVLRIVGNVYDNKDIIDEYIEKRKGHEQEEEK